MKLTHYLVAMAAVIGLASCNTDSNFKAQFIDIVTLDASNSGGSVLTYQKVDDSPMITLTTTQSFSSDQVGKRIVIVYSGVADNYEGGQSGAINILQAAPTFGGGAPIQPASVDSLDNWASDYIDYLQPYRSGKYLNLPMAVKTGYNLKKFVCYYDVTTADNAYPELHVIMKTTDGYNSDYAYNFYGSYNIGDLWNRPSVQGLKVIYNGGEKEVTIEKYPTNNQ